MSLEKTSHLKSKYESLRDEILDIKRNAIAASDEEQALEKFDSFIRILKARAKAKESLGCSCYLKNEKQARILADMLSKEKIYCTIRQTSLLDTPYAVSVDLDREKNIQQVQNYGDSLGVASENLTKTKGAEILDAIRLAKNMTDEDMVSMEFDKICETLFACARSRMPVIAESLLENDIQAEMLIGKLQNHDILAYSRTTGISNRPVCVVARVEEHEMKLVQK